MIEKYYENIISALSKINKTQLGKITDCAKLIAKTIENDGIIYIFGCGHSHIVGLDNFYRAGGLANVCAVLDGDLIMVNGAAKSSVMEKNCGIAESILERYCITPKDTFIVVSNSGVNPVPVEAAQYAKTIGTAVISIVSSEYFADKSRCLDGKKLYEVSDIYVDNCVPHGDASVQIPGTKQKMGGLSTITACFIAQSMILEAAEMCAQNGVELCVYKSGNIEGGSEYNKALINKYYPRIKHL